MNLRYLSEYSIRQEAPYRKKPSILPFLFFGVLFIAAGIWFWIKKPDLFPEPAAGTAESTPVYQQTMDVLYITQTAVDISVSQKAIFR